MGTCHPRSVFFQLSISALGMRFRLQGGREGDGDGELAGRRPDIKKEETREGTKGG